MTDEIADRCFELQTRLERICAAGTAEEVARELADALVAVAEVADARVCVLRPDGSVQCRARAGSGDAATAHPARGRLPWQRTGAEAETTREARDRSGRIVATLSTRGCAAGGEQDDRAAESQAQRIDLLAFQSGLAIEHIRILERLRREHDQFVAERDTLELTERVLRAAFDEAPIGMSMMSLADHDTGRFLRVNDALCRITGYSAGRLSSMSVIELTHPEDRGPISSALRRAAGGRRTPSRLRARYLHASGGSTWVQVTTTPVFDDDGKPLHALAHIEELRERDRPEAEFAARQDPVTGLLNQVALTEEIGSTLERARRNATTGAVLVCDLGEFAAGASDPGRSAELIASLGQRLRSTLRPEDVVGRLDDTTFAIALEELTPENAQAVAQRIGTALGRDKPRAANGALARANIGIAILADDTVDADAVDAAALLGQAESAMRAARSTGGGRSRGGGARALAPLESTRVLLYSRRPGR
ncbi:MAG: diguanylate cyclase domain-containing protein [Jatrophihabitantaceae bacterium]